MIVLLTALAASLLLLWGAYGLGRRSATLAVVGACLLVPIAWRISQLDTSHGEGAAAGVVIVVVAVWALTVLGLSLAIAMLSGAIRAHDSLVAKIGLGLVLLLSAPVFVGLSRTPTASHHESTASEPHERNAEYVRGYAWAIDQGTIEVRACDGGHEYVAGCTAGVARNGGATAARRARSMITQ
jgi:uncharacterized membrane protein